MELIFLVVACVLLAVATSMYYLEREKSQFWHEHSHDWEDEAIYWAEHYFDVLRELNRANIKIGDLQMRLLSSATEKSETKTKTKSKK